MPSTRTGHYVQILIPVRISTEWPEYVEVMGRKVPKFTRTNPAYSRDGWRTMSRELPRRKARKFAREYKKAGFSARVEFRGSPDSKVTDLYLIKDHK